MIKEVKKEKPRLPKKMNIFLRVLLLVITAALIFGAVFLIVNRDKLNFDALKRWFNYRTLSQSDTTGGGEPFPFQSGNNLSLYQVNGDLLAVSESGVRLYSPGGVAYIEDTVTLAYPACHVSGKSAVVYDAGGSFLRVYSGRVQVFDLEDSSATVLSARLSTEGYLTVITRSSGYKGVITVYDTSYSPVLRLNLSSAFVLDGIVSPDHRSVAVVTAGQSDLFFSATLAQYPLTGLDEDAPTPVATLDLGSDLPLDLSWDGGGLRVVTEYGVVAAGSDLVQTGSYGWSERFLKRFSLLGDDCFVILTGKYRSGSQTKLAMVDREGTILAERDENLPILSLSAAGKYLAVLTADKITIYTRDLTPYATSANTQGASQVVALPDGSAYLTAGDTAWLYLPD